MNGVWIAVGSLLVSTTILAIFDKLVVLAPVLRRSTHIRVNVQVASLKELREFLSVPLPKPAAI